MGRRFDRFTDEARRVLEAAAEEARRLGHAFIGTEHLLLATAHEETGIAGRALAELGVPPARLLRALEAVVEPGDARLAEAVGLTRRAKRAIELAADESNRLRHDYLGPEHLLLGLLRLGEGIGAGVLESLGVELPEARAEVERLSAEEGDERRGPAGWQRAAAALLGLGCAAALAYVARRLTRDAAAWGNEPPPA